MLLHCIKIKDECLIDIERITEICQMYDKLFSLGIPCWIATKEIFIDDKERKAGLFYKAEDLTLFYLQYSHLLTVIGIDLNEEDVLEVQNHPKED